MTQHPPREPREAELAAIEAQHFSCCAAGAVPHSRTPEHCVKDDQPWPCDVAVVLRASNLHSGIGEPELVALVREALAAAHGNAEKKPVETDSFVAGAAAVYSKLRSGPGRAALNRESGPVQSGVVADNVPPALATSGIGEEGLRRLVAEGIEAIRLTREYVDGTAPGSTDGLLPALPGWSWFDWTEKARAALAKETTNG